jgi:hypothetical protein
MASGASVPASETGHFRQAGKALEAAFALLALLAGFHFLAMRVRAGGLPGGDEGSWMSVAAELARGHGFTTRWLELHFLTPYALPRPDDFRYPALTSLLALVFRCAGTSLEAARWTVTAVFLCFASAAYLACRSAFGRFTAMASLWLTSFSLLQLDWNSVVYTEGLFGLAVALLAAWSLRGERTLETTVPFGFRTLGWWAILGAGVGLLYLVRANGILFLIGVPWLFLLRRKHGLSLLHPASACMGFLLAAAPWLIRNFRRFGNPLHVAGNAGLLRTSGEPHTMSVAQFLARHPPLYPLERFGVGALHFIQDLHQFEHGLEALPLILAAVAVFRKRPFFSPFLAAGFLATFAACCYSAYDSWAGVRYMSGLLPLVYAYGLSPLFSGPRVTSALPSASKGFFEKGLFKPRFTAPVAALGILLLLLPVAGPHRFYERKFAPPPKGPAAYAYRKDLADHLSRLAARLPEGGRYYAGALSKVNFLAQGRDCVGLQELYDSTWFTRSMAAFHPGLVVLTHEETSDTAMLAALAKMRSGGYTQDTLEEGPLAVYLSLRPMDRAAPIPPIAPLEKAGSP